VGSACRLEEATEEAERLHNDRICLDGRDLVFRWVLRAVAKLAGTFTRLLPGRTVHSNSTLNLIGGGGIGWSRRRCRSTAGTDWTGQPTGAALIRTGHPRRSASGPLRSWVRRIAAGPSVLDARGRRWLRDTEPVGGRSAVTTPRIEGTSSQTIYQHERTGMRAYIIPVPAPATYAIKGQRHRGRHLAAFNDGTATRVVRRVQRSPNSPVNRRYWRHETGGAWGEGELQAYTSRTAKSGPWAEKGDRYDPRTPWHRRRKRRLRTGAAQTSTPHLFLKSHTCGVQCLPGSVQFYFDGRPYWAITAADLPPGSRWVFDHPFFLILNLAIGGWWAGSPDASTTFPQALRVDYVRVYQ
jgi:hypothetical protein